MRHSNAWFGVLAFANEGLYIGSDFSIAGLHLVSTN